MKKLLVLICSFSLLVGSVFAESGDFFSHRIFEIKIDAEEDASNNGMSISDFLVENLVIDLPQLCDNLPASGLNVSEQTDSSIAAKFDLKHGISIGVSGGTDLYSNISISKDLFKFLGYGNELNEELSVAVDGYVDWFAYAQADIGWNFDKLSFSVQPSVFSTVVHATMDGSKITVNNTEDGNFIVSLDGNIGIYSELTDDDIENKTYTDANTWINLISSHPGFDLSGNASYKLFDYLTLNGFVRVPVVPSRLTKLTNFKISSENSFSIDDLAKSGEASEVEEDSDSSATESNFEINKELGDTTDVNYYINRPMKLSVTADFHPFGNFINYYGGIGVGIKHPFSAIATERDFYIDYLVGARFSLLNILSLNLSTERTDEIYKHKAVTTFNLRFVEIDAGIALESADFISSFKGNGIGGFITACIGF